MRLNRYTKTRGELAARRLSELAYALYCDTDPLEIHEYEDENGDPKYALRGMIEENDLTFEDLGRVLESFAAEIYEEEDEDE